MNSIDLRKAFLAFFERYDHQRVASGPVVPANDPSLLFTNAGMVPFKDIFTGKDSRSYQRATSSQKCIRISGKHNDLENVGVTARHHTFFEMLGNFSFGDYFKEQAIVYAWQFLTEVLDIQKDRLLVTVFGGDEGLAPDTEAEALWAKVSGLPTDRILHCGKADNFWQMGDTGPCGPCSEIHYFIGDGDPSSARFGDEPAIDGRGWTELWNLVFMQYEQHKDGKLAPLPKPSVDTGMGLERLSVVTQGKTSNYDTDLLYPLVEAVAARVGKTYGGTLAPNDISMRVVADHARMTAFCIAEGVMPGSSGRSYVLRRVMRRAIYHGDRLGIHEPFLADMALGVVRLMKGAYPELSEREALIEQQVSIEEEAFRRTLDRGRELLSQNQRWNDTEKGKQLPGDVAFTLYDTYGFPVDLQAVVGRDQGFIVDEEGFQQELNAAKERSRGSKAGDAAVADIYFALHQRYGDTDFVGYEAESCDSTVEAILVESNDLEENDVASPPARVQLVLKKSPFYGEAGGQLGDRGELRGPSGLLVTIVDTQKPVAGLLVHHGVVQQGELRVGQEVSLEVDHERRTATRRNHSATHLLHYALRTVLGPQAVQHGSLVGPDRLRFDFSASAPMTAEQIHEVERLVNQKILANQPITTDVLPMREAKSRGAIGIFEEKYGEVVRMLTMTKDSVELCGGTHASRTGDIGLFKVLSESGVAQGVRRIEAATGWLALDHVRHLENELLETAMLVKAPSLKPSEKVARLLSQLKETEAEVARLQRALASGGRNDIAEQAQEVGGVRLLGARVDIGDPKALREMADQLRDKLSPAVVLLGTAAKNGKALLACSVSKDLAGQYHAGKIVQQAAKIVGGGGGGRPDFAQAGGPNASALDDAVRSVYATSAQA